MQLTEEKERNARPFLCTYSSACLLPHPWADQGSDLAPTCSPCSLPHSPTVTPLISSPLSDSDSSSNGNLISHSKLNLGPRRRYQFIQFFIQRIRLELPLSNRHKASNQISSTYKQLSASQIMASTALVFATNEMEPSK
jgi:hypothetical protein